MVSLVEVVVVIIVVVTTATINIAHQYIWRCIKQNKKKRKSLAQNLSFYSWEDQ